MCSPLFNFSFSEKLVLLVATAIFMLRFLSISVPKHFLAFCINPKPFGTLRSEYEKLDSTFQQNMVCCARPTFAATCLLLKALQVLILVTKRIEVNSVAYTVNAKSFARHRRQIS